MHQPHQSEPVKSSSTILFSDFAVSSAFGNSVCHGNLTAGASVVAGDSLGEQPLKNAKARDNVTMVICFINNLDRHRGGLFTFNFLSADNRRHRPAFELPAKERAVLGFAGRVFGP